MPRRARATVRCASCGADNDAQFRFCSACGSPLGGADQPREVRKTVTVLFCDATSSTRLGEELDAEALRRLMTAYFDEIRAVVEFHGGKVEKFIGDAAMAVFGVPAVHEDDALRAIRAAAEIRERLAILDERLRRAQGAAIAWRIGVNTGEVVASSDAEGQRLVTGDAVNVAARLEQAAQPGEILLGAETHRLVRESVVAEPIAAIAVRGKAEPVSAYRLLEVTTVTGREVRPLEAPLVGRQHQLRLLTDAHRQAVEQRVCHLFTLLGPAGVGKSRLIEEFQATLGDEVRSAYGRCLAYGRGITFWPVTEALRSAATLSETDSPERAVARLSELLAGEPEADRIAAVAGELLGLESGVGAPDETFWAVRKVFEAVARTDRPLILVLDDVHWGEPAFLDLVEHLADWTRDAPILLVCIGRPELLTLRPAWGGGKLWSTTIQLEPLSGDESEELVGLLLGRHAIDSALPTRVAEMAEGNPLFVEELLAMLIDRGQLVRDNGAWTVTGDVEPLNVPSTISALLATRLDGLAADDRVVIERASVEGKVFHLAAVAAMVPDRLREAVPARVAAMTRMELLRPTPAVFDGQEAYRFRHLLIRDAAYQALPKHDRADLHERLADWLERAAGERLAESEEIIAYHLEQAHRYRLELGPPDDAVRALGERAARRLAAAGRRSVDRGDARAAADLLGRAADLVERGSRAWLSIAPDLGDALATEGQMLPADALLAEAIALAQEADDRLAEARAALMRLPIRQGIASLAGADVIGEAERLSAVFEEFGDEPYIVIANLEAAKNLHHMGRSADAQSRLGTLLDRFESLPATYFGWLGAIIYRGSTPAADALAQLHDLATRTPQYGPPETRFVRQQGALLGMLGEFEQAHRLLEVGREQLRDRGWLFALAGTDADYLGPLLILEGRYEEAAEVVRNAYEGMRGMGDLSTSSTAAGLLAAASAELGRFDDADRYARIALETSAHDDLISQILGRRALARALAGGGQDAEAERLAREAVDLAVGTDWLDERGSTELDHGRVLHAAGRDADAVAAAQRALVLFERKGVVPMVGRARELIRAWG